MLPPEIQRIVLLIGLAAVGYLLILAWTEDMQAAKTPTVYSDAPLVSQQSSVAEAELPSVDEFKLIDSDIPAETVTPSVQANLDSARLVKVETAVLEVWVDLLGGDIARVQLPTYPISLDQPDLPFLLMDRSAGPRISRSGLAQMASTKRRVRSTTSRTALTKNSGGGCSNDHAEMRASQNFCLYRRSSHQRSL